jgi:hypothetical protein
MKYIITEEQNTKLQIIRRLPEIWQLIQNLYPWQYPCDFRSLGHFGIALRIEMFETLTLDWINSENIDVVWDVVKKVYGDKIKEHYEGWCEDKESINESVIPASIRRRADRETLEIFINDGIINYPTLCDDFDDGYEYADNVIDYAVDNILWSIDDDVEEKDYYSDALDFLRSRCRQLFEDKLIEDYNFTCIENQ